MLFGQAEGTRYWTHHTLWSVVYLKQYLELYQDNERQIEAREQFEDCVNGLFSVTSEETTRKRIQQKLGMDIDEFAQISDDPSSYADSFVRNVFDLGIEQPKLLPLFRTSKHSGIDVPAVCSEHVKLRHPLWRADMHRVRGSYETAKDEIEYCRTISSDAESDTEEIEASALNNLGIIARQQSDYDAAREYCQDSREIHRELGDRAGEAGTLNNLGVIANKQSDYEAAREYYEDSREIHRELGDRAGEAKTLGNLGSVARDQNNYEAAREYYENCRLIFRRIGALKPELKTFENIIRVYENQNQTAQALEVCRDALDRIEESDLSFEKYRRSFEEHILRLDTTDDPLPELYRTTLECVLQDRGSVAIELFGEAWDRRTTFEDSGDQYVTALASGVAFAAHLHLTDSDDSDSDVEDILAEIAPYRERLPESVTVLFDILNDTEPDTEIARLTDDIDTESQPENLSTDELETLAFVKLTREIVTPPTDEIPTEELYRVALSQISVGDVKQGFAGLLTVWDRQESDSSMIESDHVINAGAGITAFGELMDAQDTPEDMKEIRETVEARTQRLSDPATILFKYVTDASPDADLAELIPERVDEKIDPDELTITELEAIAYDQLLQMMKS